QETREELAQRFLVGLDEQALRGARDDRGDPVRALARGDLAGQARQLLGGLAAQRGVRGAEQRRELVDVGRRVARLAAEHLEVREHLAAQRDRLLFVAGDLDQDVEQRSDELLV